MSLNSFSSSNDQYNNESKLANRKLQDESSSTISRSKSKSKSKSKSTNKKSSPKPKSKSKSKSAKSKRKPILNFAPLNTPLKNRLETLGVLWHTISIPVFFILFLLVVSFGWVAWVSVILPYFIWWYGFDLHTPTNGKVAYRTRDWMRNLIIWEWFVKYFPINLHKTCDLEPTFTNVLVEESTPDDEEDLISEDSRTLIDKVFKKLGLSKRLNDVDSVSPPPSSLSFSDDDEYDDDELKLKVLNKSRSQQLSKYKKIQTGPRYIFGYHPHGVISMGAMGSFATNALRNEPFQPPVNFLKPFFHNPSLGKRVFPGIGYIFPLTLTTQFTLPFYRDYLLSLGLTSASAKNIKSLIQNGDNSVCIVVGGAQESLLNNMVSGYSKVGNGYKGDHELTEGQEKAKGPIDDDNNEDTQEVREANNEEENENSEDDEKPKNLKRQIKLVLNKRKGFVKLAIELGNVSLVPTFAFGEADIYKLTIPKKGSFGYMFQQWMKNTFKFTLPFFSARGVFIYDFGFLPYRNPIDVVTGRPIHVPADVLTEYKLKHPEFDPLRSNNDQLKTIDQQAKPAKNDSFTSLFKKSSTNLKQKPKTISKPKIPQELLDHYHGLYIKELKKVYEENKHKYGYDDVELCIIE